MTAIDAALAAAGVDATVVTRRPLSGGCIHDVQRLELSDGRTLWRRVRVDGSFCASNDPRVLIGWSGEAKVKRVSIIWPDGKLETKDHLKLGVYESFECQ